MSEIIDFKKWKEERDAVKSSVEEKTVDITEAFNKLYELAEKQDSVLQMVVHDLIELSKTATRLEAMNINLGSTVRAILIGLDKKNVFSEKEFNDIWEADILPELRAAGLVKEEKKPESKIIVPPTTILVPKR